MNKLTMVKDKRRDLIVVFHNLKGFDGNFIIEELYWQGIKVENQLTTGAKTLKFHYWYMDANITFKDSLCFLPMPLAELPNTTKVSFLMRSIQERIYLTEDLYQLHNIPTSSHEAEQARGI